MTKTLSGGNGDRPQFVSILLRREPLLGIYDLKIEDLERMVYEIVFNPEHSAVAIGSNALGSMLIHGQICRWRVLATVRRPLRTASERVHIILPLTRLSDFKWRPASWPNRLS
jgi:hypothetical protein